MGENKDTTVHENVIKTKMCCKTFYDVKKKNLFYKK